MKKLFITLFLLKNLLKFFQNKFFISKIIFLFFFLLTYRLNGQDFWQKTNGPDGAAVWSLAIDSQGYIFAGSSAGIYRSTNNGNNWEQVNNGLNNNSVRSLVINSNGDIFAGTYGNGVFRSTNSGNNWEQVFNAPLWVYTMTINSNDYVFAGGEDDAFRGFLIRSTNKGSNWEQIDGGLNVDMQDFKFRALAVNSNDDIFTGTNNGVYRSTNNGNNWEQVSNGLAFNSIFTLAINSNGEIFSGTYGGGVYRSINNGNNWEQINDGITGTYITVNALAINSNDDVFAGIQNGGVFRSTNNGNSWEQINNGLTNIYVVSLAINTKGYIFAGTGNGIFISIKTTIPPEKPILDDPPNNAIDVSINPILSWHTALGAALYHLRVFTEGGSLVFDNSTIASTSIQIGPLDYNSKYFWIVSAINDIGEGPFSEPFSFTTKSSPSLVVSPSNQSVTNASGSTIFTITSHTSWTVSDNADWLTISPTSGTNDGTLTVAYSENTTTNQRVGILSVAGGGLTSTATVTQSGALPTNQHEKYDELSIPKAYNLEQNYPNPFNPVTVIKYQIPFGSNVELKIYNIFGEEMVTLVSEWKEAGYYNFKWNAGNFVSGVYFYRLIAKGSGNSEQIFIQTKKLILLK